MADAALVFATENTILHHDGLPWRLRAGEAWKADDPLVKQWPQFFTSEPQAQHIRSTSFEPLTNVEAATRAPGEQRGARGRS